MTDLRGPEVKFFVVVLFNLELEIQRKIMIARRRGRGISFMNLFEIDRLLRDTRRFTELVALVDLHVVTLLVLFMNLAVDRSCGASRSHQLSKCQP